MHSADTVPGRIPFLTLLVGTMLWSSAAAGQVPKRRQAPQQEHGTIRVDTLTPRQDSTALAQLAAAVRAARRRGRTPVVEVGAPWCGPCHVLEGVLEGPDMRAATQQMEVLSLNLDLWREALATLGFDVNTGIPRVVVIDSTGHPVGEPWRPRDVPDSLTERLGTEGGWRVTLTALFAKAREQFHQAPLSPSPTGGTEGASKHGAS